MSETADHGPRRRAIRLDLSPLRRPEFRRLFSSATVAYLGSMVGYVAIPFQLYRLTGSNFAVGLVAAVELVPLVIFGLWGGALADRLDRRTIMLATGGAEVLLSAVLLANSLLAKPQIWAIYVVAGLLAVASSLQRPSQEALMPRTVPHDQLTPAVAVWSMAWQLGSLLGPSLGGLLIARCGVSYGYAAWVVAALVSTLLLLRLGHYRPTAEEHEEPGFASIRTGLRYALSRKDLLGTYVIDMVGMFLAMPMVLFPAFALHSFDRPDLLGLFYACEGVGSAIATMTSGWMQHVHRHGRAITLAAIGWGAAIGLAGLVPGHGPFWGSAGVWIALGVLAVAGALDQVSGTFRSVLWNQTIPDGLRGRLAGIEMLSYSLGPLGGQLRSGAVADWLGVRTAIVSGGALCMAGVGASAAALRGFWSYDNRTDPHAVAARESRAAQ
ncbi:MFS transporter [Flexivirga caeni]|uniref:MFS transporter n=1 Tax=Flexivirga caeni TaxID=2294115 RepID=A0A3M9M7V0_9MICO|nr:MFS transporter [Flexivirga caeni]RNI21639.1 MFS transporter [Flexivirga caeni]